MLRETSNISPGTLPSVGEPSTAPARAQITLCGSLLAEIDGRRVDPTIPGRKGRRLFACLVVSRTCPISRDELIDVIWPTDAPADPDGAFSTLLTRLRAALGPGIVRGRSELDLDLGDDPWVDWDVARDGVAAAERRLVEGSPCAAFQLAAPALEIARRTLLPGDSTPWIDDRRRELLEARAALLETGGRAALALGGEHLPVAERHARELIDCEPYRESAYMLLMETHVARGNIAEALRVYDDLRRVLCEELGLTPSSAIRALAERLLEQRDVVGATSAVDSPRRSAVAAIVTAGAHEPPTVCSPLPASLATVAGRPLVGRQAPLQVILGAVLDRSAPTCAVVALTGEAGIGKTRLAAEVAARAHDGGHEVLHGRATYGAVAPYQPFVEALRHHLAHRPNAASQLLPVLGPELGELARIVPELRPAALAAPDPTATDAEPQRRWVFDAVSALCGEISRRRPLILVLEDLHWADAGTLLLLRHVVHAQHDAPITVLATFRDDEPPAPDLRRVLVDLLRDRALDRIGLFPLDEAETAELVAAHGRTVGDPGVADELRAQAGGNPFYIEELLRDRTIDGSLSPALREAVDSRLDRLPATTRAALAIAAAIGRSFEVGTLAMRTHASAGAMRDTLAHAIRIGILVADTHRQEHLAFRHGIVQQALLAQ